MKVGDFVRMQYDDGLGGTMLYGIVIGSGPKMIHVVWESGLDNRLRREELATRGIKYQPVAADDVVTLRRLRDAAPKAFSKSCRANVDLDINPPAPLAMMADVKHDVGPEPEEKDDPDWTGLGVGF